MTRGLLPVGLAATGASTLGILAALWVGSRRADPSAPVASRVLTLAFSGEDEGHLEPCGCTPAMLGGLARRPARIEASREPGVPLAFVAGPRLVEGADLYDRLRLRAVLEALAAMGCAAYGPSPAERSLFGADAAGVPVAGDEPLAAHAGAVPIHVIAPSGDVAGAVRGARARIGAGAPLVALTSLGAEAAHAVARGCGGPTLVLFAGGITDPAPRDAVQGPRAAAPYPAHGKFLGLAHLEGPGEKAVWRVEYRPVLHDLPEDEGIVAIRAAHLAALRDAGVVERAADDARFAVGNAPDAAYAGSAACAACHAEASTTWSASRHAAALATLVRTGDDADPSCVRCHVAGYGTREGWRPSRAAPDLADVGCEACHGPRAGHIAARRAGVADPPAPRFGERGCLLCHDGDHDPLFDFADAWPRIAHGAR